MSDHYDGPAYGRQQPLPDQRAPEFETRTGSFASRYVPPVMKNEHFKTKTNFRLIEKKLSKRPEDYYVVVTEKVEANDITPTVVETNEVNVKENVKRRSQSALGHSLSDILETEQHAQKTLKIFKD